MLSSIVNKIKKKKINVCVVGLGYVGLPLVKRLIKNNLVTYGLDNDPNKINLLKQGKKYVQSHEIEYFKKNKSNVSSNPNIIQKCDIIIVCLPTPLKNQNPDLSYIKNFLVDAKPFFKKGQILIIESTVYPGATEKLVEVLKEKKFNFGIDFFIGYSPERENPGDKNFSYNKTVKVVSGLTSNCKKVTNLFYSKIVKKTYVATSIKVAELSKLLENIYRSINISLVNELKIITEKMNISLLDVIDASSTKNFGFQKFLPGPGMGGHCIPIDPLYLNWISKKFGYESKFIKFSQKINNDLPRIITNKICKYLKKKKIKKPSVLMLGLAYKKNVDDDRESPGYKFIDYFTKKKIKIVYSDPYFKSTRVGRQNQNVIKSVEISEKILKKFSAILICTDHDLFDYNLIYKNSEIIFDTRGVYHKLKIKSSKIINF